MRSRNFSYTTFDNISTDILEDYYEEQKQLAAMRVHGLRITEVEFYRNSLLSILKRTGDASAIPDKISGTDQEVLLREALACGIKYLFALGEVQFKEKPIDPTNGTPEGELSWYGYMVTEGRNFSR